MLGPNDVCPTIVPSLGIRDEGLWKRSPDTCPVLLSRIKDILD